MSRQLDEVLATSRLKDELLKVIEHGSSIREKVSRQTEGADRAGCREIERQVGEAYRDKFRQVYRRIVEPVLERPRLITEGDFCDVAESCLIVEVATFDSAFDRFRRVLASGATVIRRSDPFQVGEGYIWQADTDGEQHLVWESGNELRVTFLGALPLAFDYGSADWFYGGSFWARRAVYFVVDGRCSTRALEAFGQNVAQVLGTIFRSLSVLRECAANALGEPVQAHEVNLTFGSLLVPPSRDATFFAPALDAYFAAPAKADSIGRRIRNAVHLLVQADHQDHQAVGLALSVAAMEALVCKKGPDLTNLFSENIAALLEPDPRLRAAAVDFLKKIYNARSKTLHGEWLEHDLEIHLEARRLAVAVLLAFIERRTFLRRSGFPPESPDDLLNELRSGKWVPGQLTGVSASPVRSLWGWRPEPDEVIP